MQQLMKQIGTIDDVIEEFGGASELGRMFGITQEAVSMWRVRGEIPQGWHHQLFVEARARGWEIGPEVFGYVGEDAARYRTIVCGAVHAA